MINYFVNREAELRLIDEGFMALLDRKRLLHTPIIEFYGVEDISKTSFSLRKSLRVMANSKMCRAIACHHTGETINAHQEDSMNDPRRKDDIIMQEEQPKDHFIGRKAEIKAFQQWLDDPEAPRILYIHDAAEEPEKKGGIGKTFLLRKCAEITQQSRADTVIVPVDFFNVGDRDRLFLAQRIMTGLAQLYPGWLAISFQQAIEHYRDQATSGGSETEIQRREDLGRAITEDLRRLDSYLTKTRKNLLVIFDTFEAIEQIPMVAVLHPSQTFPDDYQYAQMRVVIAGRNRLDWTHPNWRGREQDVQVMPLYPFSQQEMQEYIETESVYDILPNTEEAWAFYERTEGRPIIIGLAIDVLNHRILTLQDLMTVSKTEFERCLVPQVSKLENPLNWAILFMAHVYHRFNMSILDCILKNVELKNPVASISRDELARILPELSFVRRARTGSDFVLHDEMRRLVTKYCWGELDPYRRYRKDISRSVINYYEQEIVKAQNEQQCQGHMIEILYHRLFVDIDDGLHYFQGHFLSAIRFLKTAFARILLQEVQSFVGEMPHEQRSDVNAQLNSFARLLLQDPQSFYNEIHPGQRNEKSAEIKPEFTERDSAVAPEIFQRPKVFVCYSHRDWRHAYRLRVHVADLESQNLIELWSDERIRPGMDWRNEIEQAIASAKIAILLYSADLLASTFIREDELPPLLAAAEKGGTVILPVLLSPCSWEDNPKLSRFQLVNSPKKPLSKLNWHQKEEIWTYLEKTIRRILLTENPR